MDNEQVIRNLRLQLLIERIVVAVIAFTLVASWGIGRIKNSKSMILVDGKPIACVSTKSDAEVLLREIKSKTGCSLSEIGFKQQVMVARAPRDAQVMSRHKAMRAVQSAVSPVVPKWSIIVDGVPVVAVPSRKMAGEVLELAKMKYGSMVENLAEEPQFKENVTVDVAAIDPSLYCTSAEEAVKVMFSPSRVKKDETYTMRNGDVAAVIASRMGIRLDDLIAMNPGKDLARLQIDDQIRIRGMASSKPRITIVVRDLSERDETFRAPEQHVSSASLFVGKSVELSPGR
ncbi:MAG: LysM domain-containing protein, partial [Armatimonadota bacterium]